jgi:hypothetical protein
MILESRDSKAGRSSAWCVSSKAQMAIRRRLGQQLEFVAIALSELVKFIKCPENKNSQQVLLGK